MMKEMSKIKDITLKQLWPLPLTCLMVLAGVYAVLKTFLANPGIPEEMFTKTTFAEKKKEADILVRLRWCH